MPITNRPRARAPSFGAGYDNLLRARGVLEASLRAHGGLPASAGPRETIRIAYTGTLRNKGHYARPGQTREFALSGVYEYWLPGRAARHEGELRELGGGGPGASTATAIVRGDRAFERDYGDERLAEAPSGTAQRVRDELFWLLPQAVLGLAEGRAETLRWLGRHPIGGAPHDVVCFADAGGRAWNLFVDARTRRLTRVERLVAHPVEGDAVEWFEFEGYRAVAGLVLPARRREARLEDWSTWTREIRYDRIELGGAPSSERFSLPAAAPPAAESAAPRVTGLGGDAYLVELPEEDSKIVFTVFSDYVIVLEAPLSSATGERILAAVGAVAPGKPVRYLMVSHHHPHYTGGLRPFVHAGATLVTTPGNRDHLAAIAQRPQRIAPDAQAHEPRAPQIVAVSGSAVFQDKTHRLEVYDVGPSSEHTDEYLVFYLPAARLLFEGDLGHLPLGEADGAAAKRAAKLLRVVRRLGVPVERVVQSWPLKGQKVVATLAEIEAWSQAGAGHER